MNKKTILYSIVPLLVSIPTMAFADHYVFREPIFGLKNVSKTPNPDIGGGTTEPTPDDGSVTNPEPDTGTSTGIYAFEIEQPEWHPMNQACFIMANIATTDLGTHQINWASDIGTLQQTTTITEDSGYSINTLFTSITGMGTLSATLAETGESRSESVNFTPCFRALSFNNTPTSSIAANGTCYYEFDITTYGTNQEVQWSTTLGTLSNNKTYSDTDGLTSVRLTSTIVGQATVSAIIEGGDEIYSSDVSFMEPTGTSETRYDVDNYATKSTVVYDFGFSEVDWVYTWDDVKVTGPEYSGTGEIKYSDVMYFDGFKVYVEEYPIKKTSGESSC